MHQYSYYMYFKELNLILNTFDWQKVDVGIKEKDKTFQVSFFKLM